MRNIIEAIIFIMMIISGLTWLFGAELTYKISACIMGIFGLYYWFRYMVPDLFSKEDEERDFIDY